LRSCLKKGRKWREGGKKEKKKKRKERERKRERK
jgi:hypothetical protein